jgi:hypothetical protein
MAGTLTVTGAGAGVDYVSLGEGSGCGSRFPALRAVKATPDEDGKGCGWRFAALSAAEGTPCSRLTPSGQFATGGGWRLAAGGWRLAAGGWRLAAGGGRGRRGIWAPGHASPASLDHRVRRGRAALPASA